MKIRKLEIQRARSGSHPIEWRSELSSKVPNFFCRSDFRHSVIRLEVLVWEVFSALQGCCC